MTRARNKETVAQEVERLTAELDGLYATVDVDAARQNLFDLGVTEPDGFDAQASLAWLRRLPSVRLRRSRIRAQPALLFLPLALVVLAGTIALAAITSPGNSCSGARQAAATRQVASSTSRACSPTAGFPGFAGK